MSQELTKDDAAHVSSKALELNKNALRALAPAAIRTLGALIVSDETSDRVKCDAAKAVLDRIGLLPSAENRHGGLATLADVSVAELRRIADKLENEMATRAKVVHGVPIRADLAHKDGKKTDKST